MMQINVAKNMGANAFGILAMMIDASVLIKKCARVHLNAKSTASSTQFWQCSLRREEVQRRARRMNFVAKIKQ